MINGKEEKNLLVALDVGTSKIVVIVAELQEDGILKIIGLGQHLSKGLKKGVVINIDSTIQAIQRAIEEAELMADCKIKELLTNIFSLRIYENSKNPNATIIKRNASEANGLADWTIIWPLTNAELQKKTNNKGKRFVIYVYEVNTLYLLKIKERLCLF